MENRPQVDSSGRLSRLAPSAGGWCPCLGVWLEQEWEEGSRQGHGKGRDLQTCVWKVVL